MSRAMSLVAILPVLLIAASATADVVVLEEVMVPVSDGTRLATNVFLPDSDGPGTTWSASSPTSSGGPSS
jgi:predicted acyl esterase